MSHISWKLLSVADFLEQYRTEPERQGTPNTSSASPIWQRQSVQTFFSNYPWRPIRSVAPSLENFGLRLPVVSYFQHFAWDAPVPQLDQNHSSTAVIDEVADPPISLKNFSDLF